MLHLNRGKIKFYLSGILAFILLLTTFFAFISKAVVNSDIKEGIKYYTNDKTFVDIPLNQPADHEKLVVFKPDLPESSTKGKFVTDINMEDGETQVRFDGLNLSEGEDNKYYMAIKDKDFDAASFNESSITAQDETTVTLESGSKELILRKIDIVLDSDVPVVKIIDQSISDNWQKEQTSFNFRVTNNPSGIDLQKTTGDINPEDGSIIFEQKPGTIDTYTATITANQGKNINAKCTIKVVNRAGTVAKPVTTGKNIKIDNTCPNITIDESTISDETQIKQTSFEFDFSDTGAGVQINSLTGSIENGTVSFSKKSGTTDTYIATVKADTESYIDGPCTITGCDNVGNETTSITTKSIKVDHTSVQINDLSFKKISGTSEHTAIKNGDTFKVSFRLYHRLGIQDDSVKIKLHNAEEVKAQKDDLGLFFYNYTVSDNYMPKSDNEVIIVDQIICKYSLFSINYEFKDIKSDVKYYAPINVNNLKFTSNNEKSNKYVKDGDTLTFSFQTTHPVEPSEVKLNGRNTILFTSEDHLHWHADYIEENKPELDNRDIMFSFTVSDSAGNTPVTKTDENVDKIRYYAPIVVQNLRFISNNQKAGEAFAKDGDKLTLSFSTTHPVNPSEVRLPGRNSTQLISSDDMNWTALYEVESRPSLDNQDIKFSFDINDAAGNNKVTKSQEDTAKVRYYAPIIIQDLKFVSDNAVESDIAKNGNVLTLSFNVSHPIELSEVNIADSTNVMIQDRDQMIWTVKYTVRDGDTSDQANVKLHLKADDKVGNDSIYKNTEDTSSIKYYAPIRIESIKIQTNNQNDKDKYAKNGDNITIDFTANHEITLSQVKIADVSLNESNIKSQPVQGDIKYDWTLTYQINGNEISDLSEVNFSFAADDLAGNDTVFKNNMDSDVVNHVIYYAPITFAASIATDNVNSNYAKNGSNVMITFFTNHSTEIISSEVFGRAAINTGNHTDRLSVSYLIPENEMSLSEGTVFFHIAATDVAGNNISINDTNDTPKTSVIYDRTNPAIDIMPDFSGFTNQDTNYSLTFSDANLDANHMSVKVNGIEMINSSDRAAALGNTSYTKSIDLTEGEYTITGTCTDLAGNKVDNDIQAKIIINKTAPNITSTKLDINTIPVFKSNFIISDFVHIDSKYLKDVICNISDKSGTYDWDISDPITDSGRKTVYLLANDMCNNSSKEFTFDIYIDDKAPHPIIKDMNSDKLLNAGSKTSIYANKVNLSFSLEDLWVGNQKPDEYTSLKLYNQNNEMIEDILEDENAANGTYCASVDKKGEYKIVADATDYSLAANSNDSQGNKIHEEYYFSLEGEGMIGSILRNKTLLYSSITFVVLALGGIFIFLKFDSLKKVLKKFLAYFK